MSNDFGFKIGIGIIRYLGFLVAITMHQAGIALMAHKKGDKSHSTMERATLNPLPHIEIIGTVILPIITILSNSPIVLGWPKAHQIDTRYFKKLREDINVVYLSGLGINFGIAIICMILLRFLGGGVFVLTPALDLSDVTILIKIMLALIGLTNMTLGAFFVLPLPGTSGWNILLNNVSYNISVKLQEKMMMILVIGLILIILGLLNFYFKFFVALFFSGSGTIIGF